MGHFAKVLNGKVLNVIVAEPEFFETYVDTQGPGEWIQTSYNTYGNTHTLGGTPLRGNYAHKGGYYDAEGDAFYSEQPYPSWILNRTTWLWEAPVDKPNDDKIYMWQEDTLSWILSPFNTQE